MWIGVIAALMLPGAVTASVSLDANAIRRVFRRHEAQIKYCYEQQLQKDRKLRGRLVLNATIDGNGRVSSVEISESELANDALHACITTAVRTWNFPVAGNHAIYTVVYPYVFEPAAK